MLRTLLAAACAVESGHLTLMNGAGEREARRVASRRGAREEERTGGATPPHPSMLLLDLIRHIIDRGKHLTTHANDRDSNGKSSLFTFIA